MKKFILRNFKMCHILYISKTKKKIIFKTLKPIIVDFNYIFERRILKLNPPPHLYLRQGDQTLFPQYNLFQIAFPCFSEKIPPENMTI